LCEKRRQTTIENEDQVAWGSSAKGTERRNINQKPTAPGGEDAEINIFIFAITIPIVISPASNTYLQEQYSEYASCNLIRKFVPTMTQDPTIPENKCQTHK